MATYRDDTPHKSGVGEVQHHVLPLPAPGGVAKAARGVGTADVAFQLHTVAAEVSQGSVGYDRCGKQFDP